MAEEDKIFDSNIKYKGIFTLADVYQFCYDWLEEEEGMDVAEKKYSEKLKGNEKEVDIEWEAEKKLTDYFKIKIKIEYQVLKLKEVQIQKEGKKIDTNQGEIKLIVKGFLVKDYDGKFERDAFRKFLRSTYEKWIITSRVQQFEDKIFGTCNDFLTQIKAYLDLEGKK